MIGRYSDGRHVAMPQMENRNTTYAYTWLICTATHAFKESLYIRLLLNDRRFSRTLRER